MGLRGCIAAIRRWLPDGRALPDDDWRPRHRYITLVLALHVPLIPLYALLTGQPLGHAVVDALPPLVILGFSVRVASRVARTLAVATGLITCSAIFVHLSGGLIEWHFHYFVMLALISLYAEWRVYLLALAFVVLQHGIGGAIDFDGVYNHGDGNWYWALVHGGFVLAASACHITFWRFQEASDRRAEAYRAEAVARAQQVAEVRSDLIATASHEFRTPITAVTGAAKTLMNHESRLSAADREALFRSIVDRAEGLSAMLESMLVAAQVEAPQPGVTTPVSPAVDAVVKSMAGVAKLDSPVELDVEPELWVACSRPALHHVLERLVTNAVRHAAPSGRVRLGAARAGDRVRFEVSGPAGSLSVGSLEALAEPFHDPAALGRSADLGLGLYAVRRIADVHGGHMSTRIEDDHLVITVEVPRGAPPAVDIPAQPRSHQARARRRLRH